MLIRIVKKDDIDSINKLDRESVKYHEKFDKDFHMISETFWKIKINSQMKAMKSPTDIIFVAEINGKIVGYVWGYIKKMTKFKIGIIQELIVSSTERKRGIGTKLIEHILQFFRMKKCIISKVEVYVKNIPATETYKKFGFEKNEYIMQLKLDKSKKFTPFLA